MKKIFSASAVTSDTNPESPSTITPISACVRSWAPFRVTLLTEKSCKKSKMWGRSGACGVSHAACYLFVSLDGWQEMHSDDTSERYECKFPHRGFENRHSVLTTSKMYQAISVVTSLMVLYKGFFLIFKSITFPTISQQDSRQNKLTDFGITCSIRWSLSSGNVLDIKSKLSDSMMSLWC